MCVPEKPTVLAGHLKHTQCLSNNTLTSYTPPLPTVDTQHDPTLHTQWGCAVELASARTAATVLADGSVTHRLRNDLKCVELDVKPYYTYTHPYPNQEIGAPCTLAPNSDSTGS